MALIPIHGNWPELLFPKRRKTHIQTHTQTRIDTYRDMHIYIHIYIYIHMWINNWTHKYIYIHIYIYTCLFTYIYVCLYVYVYVIIFKNLYYKLHHNTRTRITMNLRTYPCLSSMGLELLFFCSTSHLLGKHVISYKPRIYLYVYVYTCRGRFCMYCCLNYSGLRSTLTKLCVRSTELPWAQNRA